MPQPVLVAGARTQSANSLADSHRCLPRLWRGPPSGCARASGDRRGAGRHGDFRERRPGPAADPNPARRRRRRYPAERPGGHAQQAVPVRAYVHCPGRRPGRRRLQRDRRCGRHRVDVECSPLAAGQPGRRQVRGAVFLDALDSGRAGLRLRRDLDGGRDRALSDGARDHPRRPGRLRRRLPRQGRRGDQRGTAGRGDRPGSIPGREAPDRGRPTRASGPNHRGKARRAAARVQRGRHHHRRIIVPAVRRGLRGRRHEQGPGPTELGLPWLAEIGGYGTVAGPTCRCCSSPRARSRTPCTARAPSAWATWT